MPIVHSVKFIPIYLHLFEWSNISLIVLCLKSVWWLMAVVVVACQSLFCLQEDCDKTQVPPPNNWSCLSPLHPWSLIISLQSNVYYFICDHFAFFFRSSIFSFVSRKHSFSSFFLQICLFYFLMQQKKSTLEIAPVIVYYVFVIRSFHVTSSVSQCHPLFFNGSFLGPTNC